MRKPPIPRARAPLSLTPLFTKPFHPPKGQKQIFLPTFTLTLLRTPHSPPHFATFLTPLHLNKLDLRDYLWRAYGLQALGVRSYVLQAKVQMDRNGARAPGLRRWFRPRATKKMTVELARNAPGQGPFVWPDPPEDLAAWDKPTFERQTAEQKEERDRRGPDAALLPKRDGKVLAAQARELVRGGSRWRSGWGGDGV